MKQHITVQDLNDLSEKGKERLREWWDKKYKHRDAPHSYQSEDPYVGVEYGEQPILSIGQMIEFLDKNRKRDWAIYFGKNLAFVQSDNGVTLLGKTPENRKGDLCNGLWAAVKEVLEK